MATAELKVDAVVNLAAHPLFQDPESEAYAIDFVHFSPTGAALAASLIYEKLEGLGIV